MVSLWVSFPSEKTMNTQNHTYRFYRRNFAVPASHALRMMRDQAALAAQMDALGFRWQKDRHYNPFAEWQQDGFTLRATVHADENGWWDCGVSDIGEFISKWRPGAIKHRHGDRNRCDWFLPVNPEYGREDYRRACAFGKDWWYVFVKVKASRADVILADEALYGIDYEPGGDDRYLTETALELADQAIATAQKKLQVLCGCH
jgi:hypothetical protein